MAERVQVLEQLKIVVEPVPALVEVVIQIQLAW